MIDIAIALYAISLLSSLDELSELILFATFLLIVFSPLIAKLQELEKEYLNTEKTNDTTN